MKVLISAYACEPERGSEPGVGWNWVFHLSQFHEVWVVTRAENQETIDSYLLTHPLPAVHWIYVNLPGLSSLFKRGHRGEQIYYLLWQLVIYFAVKRLQRKIGFDIIHHVTLVNYWIPTFLAILPVPYIWGPVGGGDATPAPFYASFPFRKRMFEYCRRIACRIGESCYFVSKTAKKASVALATTQETALRLKKLGADNVQLFSQVALPESEIEWLTNLPVHNTDPFRIVSLGNLLHLKGYDLAIKAFKEMQAKHLQSEYWLIGEGPERTRLLRLVQELRIADRVHFLGTLPRKEAFARLAQCSVLLHPCLHDSVEWACAEAMAAGQPVICLDLAGPTLQVTEKTGYKIPAISPEQVVSAIANAMLELARNPERRMAMGWEARSRVKENASWKGKAEIMNRFYNVAAANR